MSHGTTNRAPSAARQAVGAALAAVTAIVGLGTMTSSAGALPYNDPYENITPTTTYPRPDLTVSVRFAPVFHYSTGAWEGSKAIVTVENSGDKSAGAFSVRVYGESRDELGYYMVRSLTHKVSGLGAGRSVSIESLYFRRYCTVGLTATADVGKTVYESNENNNGATANLRRCNY